MPILHANKICIKKPKILTVKFYSSCDDAMMETGRKKFKSEKSAIVFCKKYNQNTKTGNASAQWAEFRGKLHTEKQK